MSQSLLCPGDDLAGAGIGVVLNQLFRRKRASVLASHQRRDSLTPASSRSFTVGVVPEEDLGGIVMVPGDLVSKDTVLEECLISFCVFQEEADIVMEEDFA